MGPKPQDTAQKACFARAAVTELRKMYPHHTAKHVARDLGCTPKAASNLLDGHLSAVSLGNLINTYGPGWVAERVLEAAGYTLQSYVETQVAEAEAAAARALERAKEARALNAKFEAARRHMPGDAGARP